MYETFTILDRETFTSDTDTKRVFFEGVCDHIALSLRNVQDGATAPTLADHLSVVSRIEIKQNGVMIGDYSLADIVAFNALAYGNDITYVVGAGDNEEGFLDDVQLPILANSANGDLTIKLENTDNSDTDAETLSLIAKYRRPRVGDRTLRILTHNYTAPATGSLLKAFDHNLSGALMYMLVFSTTVPSTSGFTTSADYLEILYNGSRYVYEGWGTIGSESQSRLTGDTSLDGVLDNYKLFNFTLDPFMPSIDGKKPATLTVKVNAGDTNAIRFLTVEALGVKPEK